MNWPPADQTLKRGDLRSPLRAQLYDRATGEAVDLTLATAVAFYFSFDPDLPGSNGACTVIDAATGVVEYQWQAGDTDTAGQLLGEFKVTWPSGLPQTFPSRRYLHIEIEDDLS